VSGAAVVGRYPEAPAELLTAIEIEVLPIDLVTEWRRCGMVADFLADYVVHAFERRDAARSILSTVANEPVENAAKFSVDKRTPARVAIRHHGDAVHAEVRNVAGEKQVQGLREVLADLGRGDATAVFHARVERRMGLGLALLARDYGALVGATIGPADGAGRIAVCLRVALSTAEVEQR
jgi:hypothetical protein